MTRTMQAAILEIAENGERFAPTDLNVSRRTVEALAKRGFIALERGIPVVTDRGWSALAAA